MPESTLVREVIVDGQNYIVGYSLVQKEQCEVLNFISPTLRVLRFVDGAADWKIDGSVECFRRGDIVVLSNLNKRNIHKLHTPTITYEVFDFYPSCLSDEALWPVFYQGTHKTIGASDDSAAKIDFLLDTLKDEITEKKDSFQIFSIRKILDLLAVELMRSMTKTQSLSFNTAMLRITQSVKYITEHFRDDLSVGSLAQMCGYSLEHYSRQFCKYIGITPNRYIMNLRFENAVHLMNTQKLTVQEAAERSGFCSPSAFYRAQIICRSNLTDVTP